MLNFIRPGSGGGSGGTPSNVYSKEEIDTKLSNIVAGEGTYSNSTPTPTKVRGIATGTKSLFTNSNGLTWGVF